MLILNVIREFDGIRDFITSVTISTLIDLPFVFIFLLVIYILAGPLVIIPLLAIPVILVYGFSVQKALQQAAEQASQAASPHQGERAKPPWISGLSSFLGVNQS